MDIKYRVTFTVGGFFESRDLEEVRTMRNATQNGGVIAAIELVHTVTNDPQARNFESADEAMEAAAELRSETFQPNTAEVFIDPQPEGLND